MTQRDMSQFVRQNHRQRGLIGKNVQQSSTDDHCVTDSERLQRSGQQDTSSHFRLNIQLIRDFQVIQDRL